METTKIIKSSWRAIALLMLSTGILCAHSNHKHVHVGAVYNKGTYNHAGSHGNIRSEFMQGWVKTQTAFSYTNTKTKLVFRVFGYVGSSSIGNGSTFTKIYNRFYDERNDSKRKYQTYRANGSRATAAKYTLEGTRNRWDCDFVQSIAGKNTPNGLSKDGTTSQAKFGGWYSGVIHSMVDEVVQTHAFGHNLKATHEGTKKLRGVKYTLMRSQFRQGVVRIIFSDPNKSTDKYGKLGSSTQNNTKKIRNRVSTAAKYK